MDDRTTLTRIGTYRNPQPAEYDPGLYERYSPQSFKQRKHATQEIPDYWSCMGRLEAHLKSDAPPIGGNAWLRGVEETLERAARPIIRQLETDYPEIIEDAVRHAPHLDRHCRELQARSRSVLHALGRMRERVYESLTQTLCDGGLAPENCEALVHEVRDGGLRLLEHLRTLEQELRVVLFDIHYQDHGNAD